MTIETFESTIFYFKSFIFKRYIYLLDAIESLYSAQSKRIEPSLIAIQLRERRIIIFYLGLIYPKYPLLQTQI